MNFRTDRCRLSAALALLFIGTALFPRAIRAEEPAADKTADIERLFREGVDLYQQGRFAEAGARLRQLHALDPRKELVTRLVDEAGTRVMARMMADLRMGNEPAYLWQYYRQYKIKMMADKERMAKMAQRLVDPGTSEDERALLYREFGELGHYAVPVLAPYLKDATHEDFRTFARIAVSRMGPRAVLAVLQLVSHKDALMRENAILLLSDIQPLDPRAIPFLKARLEDPAETPAVKNVAERVLKRISGLPAAELRAAADSFFDAANRYYLERAGVAEEAEDVEGMVWHLNEAGDLVALQYPLWAWNEQMAEELVLRGLAANPENTSLLPLWACVLAAEYTEVKDLMDIVNETPAQHNFSTEEKKEVEAWDKKLVDVRRLVGAVGKENCNAALNKTLADLAGYPGHARLPQVGAFLAKELAVLDPRGDLLTPPPEVVIDALPGKEPISVKSTTPLTLKAEQVIVRAKLQANAIEITTVPTAAPADKQGAQAKGKEVPAPAPEAPAVAPMAAASSSGLARGLDCPEAAVHYACALSLAAINSYPNRWLGSEKAAAVLGRGMSENKAVQILLVEESHNASNEMRGKLEALGYGVSAAISGRDSLLQARSFPPKDIAIISENLRRDLSTEQLLEELKADVRTRYLALGVLHERKDRALIQSRFGTDVCLVEREMSGNDLKTAVGAIEAKRTAESASKRKAHEIAVACATALSRIDPRGTWLVLEDAVEHAIGALVNRKDEVRNPAAIFLGRMGGGSKKQEAAEKLKAVVLDTNNAVELRRNAVRALGLVQREGLDDVYRKLQADADQEIKDLAAESFGQVSRPNKAVIDFIRAERIEKDKKEK